MRGAKVARHNLDRLEVDHLVERVLLIDAEVLALALSRDLVRERHLDDDVGILTGRMHPSLGKRRQRRRLTGSLRSAGVGPGHERVDLVLCERHRVTEAAVAHVGIPGRHLPGQDLPLDCPGPRTRCPVRSERHRRYLARSMTDCAVLIEDDRDVPIERRFVFGVLCRHHRMRQGDETDHQDESEQGSPSPEKRPLVWARPVDRDLGEIAPGEAEPVVGRGTEGRRHFDYPTGATGPCWPLRMALSSHVAPAPESAPRDAHRNTAEVKIV